MGLARAVAAIHHSIEKGYTGIYEPDAQKQRNSPAGDMPDYSDLSQWQITTPELDEHGELKDPGT